MKADTYLSGLFWVAGCTGIAVLGQILVHKSQRSKPTLPVHDVGGYLLSIIGTMYAVILGLVVVDSMSKFQIARQTTEQEANDLADIILLSNQLPTANRDAIRDLVRDYIASVVEDEWPAMELGLHSERARKAAIAMVDEVTRFEPTTEQDKAIYAAELTIVCEFWNNRRTRTNTAANGVPGLIWLILILGGVITVTFTYFFKLEELRVQVIMTALVAAIITLNVYLVLMFGYPFSGELRVSPSSFHVAEEIVEHQSRRP